MNNQLVVLHTIYSNALRYTTVIVITHLAVPAPELPLCPGTRPSGRSHTTDTRAYIQADRRKGVKNITTNMRIT